MALSNDPMPHDSYTGMVQDSTHYGDVFGESSRGLYVVEEHQKSAAFEDHDRHDSEKASCFVKNFGMISTTSSSSLSSPSSTNSNRLVFQPPNYEPGEAHSLIDFKTGYHDILLHTGGGSLLSFNQSSEMIGDHQDHDDYASNVWEDALSPRILRDFNCIQTATALKGSAQQEGEPLMGWLTTESSDIAIAIETTKEFGLTQEASFNKRPHMGGESTQLAVKKQCTTPARKPKPKSCGSTPSKDPQSIAAKNRRERISERLKTLQELVPNGSKVDLVTMLEKAINYVKFLQLQVKVLAADEFWPVQGGKAPDLSQVKEAIDAILSSQKDRNSSSK